MHHDPGPARWGMTIGLLILAILAVAAAPRLRPEPEPEPTEDVARDFCVTVGKFECCYREPQK